MSNKIPTAEEFSQKVMNNIFENILSDTPKNEDMIAKGLIEFAKLHVQAALEAIVDNVEMVGACVHQPERPKLTSDSVYEEDLNGPDYIWTVSKESILEAYPLENVK